MTHPEQLQHAETVAWAAQGHRDAMGALFSDWGMARYHGDGRAMRDEHGRQVFMTHAQWLELYGTPTTKPAAPMQKDLFA